MLNIFLLRCVLILKYYEKVKNNINFYYKNIVLYVIFSKFIFNLFVLFFVVKYVIFLASFVNLTYSMSLDSNDLLRID